MGAKSQRKGRQAEIELCRILNDNNILATPGALMNYGAESDICGVKGFHCEVKRHERIEIGAWMKQAEADAVKFEDGAPVVFFRRSREPWRVVMNLKDWMKMYQEYAKQAGDSHSI